MKFTRKHIRRSPCMVELQAHQGLQQTCCPLIFEMLHIRYSLERQLARSVLYVSYIFGA